MIGDVVWPPRAGTATEMTVVRPARHYDGYYVCRDRLGREGNCKLTDLYASEAEALTAKLRGHQ